MLGENGTSLRIYSENAALRANENDTSMFHV